MGKSWSTGQLTSEMVEEYAELTYLSRAEIVHIYKRFQSANKDGRPRLPASMILEEFRELMFNPFRDRILIVFSSRNDGRLSFEDVLDMASALSKDAPPEVKTAWAFKIFDIDGDQVLGMEDIGQIINMITSRNIDQELQLSREEKNVMIKNVMEEIDLDKTKGITSMEFNIALSKVGSFLQSFQVSF